MKSDVRILIKCSPAYAKAFDRLGKAVRERLATAGQELPDTRAALIDYALEYLAREYDLTLPQRALTPGSNRFKKTPRKNFARIPD